MKSQFTQAKFFLHAGNAATKWEFTFVRPLFDPKPAHISADPDFSQATPR